MRQKGLHLRKKCTECKIDGYKVPRRLKRHPRLRPMPPVAVTPLAMVGDRDTLLATGFAGFLGQPLAPDIFVADVATFLQGVPS